MYFAVAWRADAVGPKSARIHDSGRRMAWADSATWFILYREYVRSVAPGATPTTSCCGTIVSPGRGKARSPRSADHGNVAHGCLPCRLCATRQSERSSRRCLRCREPCGCPQVGARALDDAVSRRMHGNDAVRNVAGSTVRTIPAQFSVSPWTAWDTSKSTCNGLSQPG